MKSALCLFFFALSAQMLPAALLVGNIGSPSATDHYSISGSPNFVISSYFTTGATPWSVEEVIVPLRTSAAGTAEVELALWSDDAGSPGALLGVIGSETIASDTFSNVAFQPAEPLVLNGSTNYWVALRYLSGTAPQAHWSFTLDSQAEPGGEPGAAIPATNNYALSEDGGSTWDSLGWEPQIFRVTGVAVPEPSALFLWGPAMALAAGLRRR